VKATVSVTYSTELEIGDVPAYAIKALLEQNYTDLNMWELDTPNITTVEVDV
jgi:hypothetical protein